MSKSYKEMNIVELTAEIKRVENLLATNKHPLTQKQNRKYLSRLKNLRYEYMSYTKK